MQVPEQSTACLLTSALLVLACGQASSTPEAQPVPQEETDESPVTEAPDQSSDESAGTPDALLPPQATELDPERVVAKVDGVEIRAGEVEERIQMVVAQQTGGQGIPAEQMVAVRAGLTPQIIEELVDDRLLDAAAAEVVVSPEECRIELDMQVHGFLISQGMTQSDFEDRIRQFEGISLEEFLTKRAADPQFIRGFKHQRLLETKYADDVTVTDEEIRTRYESEKEQIWEKGPSVRASHILFKPKEDSDAVRAEAERVLALCRADGADFAALAKEHSEGPSGPTGGDLGPFPREGVMIEQFAAAAFAMEVGEISDLVETQFGLHIIKVTERREGTVVSLDEASPVIRRLLRGERVVEARAKLLTALRESQTIEIL